jgi:hypothetical protein
MEQIRNVSDEYEVLSSKKSFEKIELHVYSRSTQKDSIIYGENANIQENIVQNSDVILKKFLVILFFLNLK